MKLEKYEDKNKKRIKVILTSLGIILLISVSLLLYKTFASFTESVEFPMMNGKVDYFGNSDVYFAFYKNGELVNEMPEKSNIEGLLYDHGECDNGARIVFDYKTWAPLVKNLSKTKTKCSLYFSEKGPGEYYANKVVLCSKNNNAANCLKENADYDTLNLAYDKTSDNNLRYIGNNPNNYVKFNDEIWRIVGVMNNIDNGEGITESRIKIVNSKSIGSYLYDNKPKGEGSSLDDNGSNSWFDSTLKNVLNSGAYWNKTSGECPSERKNVNEPCDFSGNGLTDDAKRYIGNAVWNIGAVNPDKAVIMKDFYDLERGNEVYNTSYPTKWKGEVGLLYLSDYSFALGNDDRNTCLNTNKANWTTDEYSYCKENDWLYFKDYDGYWTITPINSDSKSVFRVTGQGGIGWKSAGTYKNEVLPSVYLNADVKIIGGTGEESTPFILKE